MGSKVLLADDSVTIQKVVGIIFANEDYSLEVVGNGDDALQKARDIKPDLMLVDALMPGKNGYEVCQEIRRDPLLQHISLLLMTGAFDVVDEEKKRQSGADDFITKPFESQSLLEVTARLISLSRDRSQNQVPPQLASAPVPPQPVAAPPAAPVAPPAAPTAPVVPQAAAADDIWGGDFAAGITDEVAPATPAPATPTQPVSPAVAAAPAPVAAKADDDLWGVFDMDAVDATASASPAAALNEPPVKVAGDDEFFAFDGEETSATVTASATDEFVLEEMVSEPVVEEPQKAAAEFDAFGEFDLEQEAVEQAPAPVVEQSSIPLEEDFSNISFDAPQQAAPVVAAPSLPPAAAPVTPAAAVIPEPAMVQPPPVVAAPLSAAVPASLDEEQLKALLSNVSRDMIEKIVWEVVPDLAESIIREEIRKIKEGIGR